MARRVKITEVRELVEKAHAYRQQAANELHVCGNKDNPQIKELRMRHQAEADVLEAVAQALRGDKLLLGVYAGN